MGRLIDGQWIVDDATAGKGGAFQRAESVFRNRITADGSSAFPAEPGRYHLFLAHSCPWAHRTQITVHLKALQETVGLSFAVGRRGNQGWSYQDRPDDLEPGDPEMPLHRLYTLSEPGCTGRVTTPTLWDRHTRRVINNESAEIVRMLNEAFPRESSGTPDLSPPPLRPEIDRINERVYSTVNNGVYRCGFARTQEAYEEAFRELFGTLDWLEVRLAQSRFLVGAQLTEADIRLFPTLVRFDPVYHGHFKCNQRRIADYPNLSNYLRDLFQTPGIGETVDIERYKQGYYGNSPRLNPSGIIPAGPALDHNAPHDRATRTYTA